MAKMRNVGSEEGFTLLEVLIAMAVMAIGLLGVAAMQLNAINGNAYGSKLNEATERIESKMEALRNLTYDEVKPEAETIDAEGYIRKTIVRNNTPEFGTKTVEVQVSWADQTGRKHHQITFRKIIAR